MQRKWMLVLGLASLGSWTAYSWADLGADAKSTIANATKALGSESLRSIEFSGSGSDFTVGQNANPSLPWPKFNDKTYTRVINLEPLATRMQRVRTQALNPPRGGGQQPIIGDQNQTQVVAAGSAAAAALPDDLMMIAPQVFLKTAAAARDLSAKVQTKGGKKYTVVSFTAVNKAPAMGYIDAQGMLERVETKIDNNVLGDIVFETAFMDYKDFGGVKFPTHIVQKQGGYDVLDLMITDVKPNAPATIADQGKGGAAPPPAAAATEKLSDGVWLVTGGYAALVFDMKDHILIVEGGQNDQRSEQVMAEAKKLVPAKPIKFVINTHSHFDHAGGLRAYVAEGATIITHPMNKAYYEKIWANPHTLAPDRLAKNPKKPSFKTVADHMTITDGNHVIELYRQTDFGHHDAMLLVYLPKEKILVEADGFNPPAQTITQTPATISPYNVNLADNIARLKLDVQRIIPIHLPADNRKVSMGELMKAIGKG